MKSKFRYYNIVFLGILYSIFLIVFINLRTEDIDNYLIVNLLRLFLVIGLGLLEFISFVNELIRQEEEMYVPKMLFAFLYSIIVKK